MAKLDSHGLFEFAAATTAITLTTSRRLLRNFRYYKDHDENPPVQRDELAELCRSIRQNAFSLQNLMLNEATADSPFLVSVAGEIYDQLEELHRKLLFFDADQIVEIIPLVDSQRKFWKHLTEAEFYSESLLPELEKNIPGTLHNLEEKILELPVHTSA